MLKYPDISPVILKIGPLQVRWYGLMYIFGVLFGYLLVKKYLIEKLKLTSDQIFNIFSGIILGILLGGRLGYIIFYNFSHYLYNPLSIFAVWKGGMSYHGGAIGCVVSLLIFSKLYKLNIFTLLDLLGMASTIGLGLGRLGNFINAELYGRITSMPWGMIFPNAGGLPRHPSQLYEAFFEGLVLFLILYLFFRYIQLNPGFLFCLYLFFYGVFRIFLEIFREPDAHLGFIMKFLTMGQILSILMIILSIGLSFFLYKKYKNIILQ